MRCGRGWLLLLLLPLPALADGRPMTVGDLLAVKSVADPQISPDGKQVVYVVSEIDVAQNKSNSDLWLVALAGGEPRRLTSLPGADNQPRWSPDGKQIAFISQRSGSSQIWLLPLDGGEARQLTKLPIDIAGPIWSPRGDKLAFAAEVYPGASPAATAERDQRASTNKSKARAFDSLMIRHWTSWDEGKRSHLFVCDASSSEARDLTPKLTVNTPPAPFGGSSDYAWSPDGKELAFTAEPLKNPAWSTNTDIWVVPAAGGEARNLTASNPGADAQPSYAPDGKAIAYVSQARAGFEADRWVLTMRARDGSGAAIPMSDYLDRPVQSFVWGDDKGTVYAVLDDQGTESIAMLWPFSNHHDKADQARVITGGVNTAVCATPKAGPDPAFLKPGSQDLVFLRADAAHPPELFTAHNDGSGLRPLSKHNAPLLAQLDLATAEGFRFGGAGGDEVTGWLIRPPGFDPARKYPVVFLIHGGPQGAWHDEWHNRWNYQLFAARGYAVVAINPRGSTGYGQSFTDQISTDWNGRVYTDLMKGLDHAFKTYPFLDEKHVAAAGGSFGGYMVNWIAGHTDRFQALISHAGIFDLTSMNVTTEELWFSAWEFGGMPWETPDRHREQSPGSYVQNFKTPTLVIHGALDFRVPDGQGLAMFTALQRRGIASRYLFFPDEGHWVLKPANRIVWWREVHDWLDRYLKSAGT